MTSDCPLSKLETDAKAAEQSHDWSQVSLDLYKDYDKNPAEFKTFMERYNKAAEDDVNNLPKLDVTTNHNNPWLVPELQVKQGSDVLFDGIDETSYINRYPGQVKPTPDTPTGDQPLKPSLP